MSKTHDADISNQELLEAINAGFSAMQQQMDDRFAAVDRRFDEVDKRFEENAEEHAAMNRKLDNTIARVDDYDRRLETVEAKAL